jgi:3-phosphoshikimate 1-carboxyvinyltransferase
MNKSFLESLTLAPCSIAKGVVNLPGSKSISNRVLLLAALSSGETFITNLLESGDTQVMLNALKTLGVSVTHDAAKRTARITSGGGKRAFTVQHASLFLGNAGTAVRPLTAALALLGADSAQGGYRLHGVPRMHERPIADLIEALRALGCSICCEQHEGFLPIVIGEPQLDLHEPVRVRGDVSSQFLSALLLALPLVAEHKIVIEVTTELISKPYVEITLALLAKFGVQVKRDGWQRFTIPAGSRYTSPGEIAVEGDASSASYFIAAGVLGGGPLTVQGAGSNSIQGDVQFARELEKLGAQIEWSDDAMTARGLQSGVHKLRGGTVDCVAIPDAAMTLAMLGLYADSPLTLTGIASWRVKETDRIAAMATEMRKLGAQVEAGDDFITVHPCAKLKNAEIATYDDHRMAMCFSLAAFGGSEVKILEPGCVAKTYPEYFQDFSSVVS